MDEIGRYYESFLASQSRELRFIDKIVNMLEGCTGITSPSYREKVQGGDSTPAAQRRIELQDVLGRCYPVFVSVVNLFRRQTDKKRLVYCHAIMDGLTGPDMKSRGIGAGKRRECMQWLTREMAVIEKMHGVR